MDSQDAMAEKKQVRVYESDKRKLHDRKNYGESYADVVERLLEESEDAEADDQLQIAD